MRRLPPIFAAVGVAALAVCGVGVGPAAGRPSQAGAAPPADEVARAIADAGWYGQDGAAGDRRQLATIAERLTGRAEPIGFALLAEEPAGSSTAYAEDVLDALIDQGEPDIRTVVALSDADVGVVSDVWSDQAIDDALDQTIDELRSDPADGLEALADALAAQPTGFEEENEPEDDGPSTGLVALGVVGIAGLALASRFLRGSGPGGLDDDLDDDYRRRRWRRQRRYRSARRRSRPARSRTRRRSSSRSRRGRGGRRL